MAVPLTWLVERPDLRLRHAGGRIEGVEATWSHAIELVDPSPWLAGGELVLTTGLRMPRSRVEQAKYVDRLVEHGAAGLAFGIGLRWHEIPRGLVDRCDTAGLALLEVPLATPFVAISQAVARRLSEDGERSLQEVVRFQQELTRVTLRNGLPALATRLARVLNAKVAIIDEAGRVAAVTRGGVTLADRARQRLTDLAPRSQDLLVTMPDEPRVELHALVGHTTRRGWLVVESATQVAESRILLNHAVTVATLHLDGPLGVMDAVAAAGAAVLTMLLEARTATGPVVESLNSFGFDQGAEVRVCVLEARAIPPTTPTALDMSTGEFAAQTRGLLASAGAAHIVIRQGGEIVALVPAAGADMVVEALTGLVDAVPKAMGVVIGVSRSVPAALAGEGLAQARRAVRGARLRNRSLGRSEAVGLETILADSDLRDRLFELTAPSLDPLLGNSASPQLELVRTLGAYLDHNGSWEAAARDLGVHRHTLRSRMDKVRELTGLDPELAQDRVFLTLALATLDGTRRAAGQGPADPCQRIDRRAINTGS